LDTVIVDMKEAVQALVQFKVVVQNVAHWLSRLQFVTVPSFCFLLFDSLSQRASYYLPLEI